jgi:preprotein translocase subunit SecG
MDFAYYTVMTLFVLVSLLLLLLVLIQKGRGGGLASAFGGGGGHTPFGTKTGDVLTWATSILFGVFILLAIILNLISNHRQQVLDKPVTTVGYAQVQPESLS